MNRMTGLDLRLKRTEAGVTQTRLAQELGVSRQQVTYLEAVYRPSPHWVDRYLNALIEIVPPGQWLSDLAHKP